MKQSQNNRPFDEKSEGLGSKGWFVLQYIGGCYNNSKTSFMAIEGLSK